MLKRTALKHPALVEEWQVGGGKISIALVFLCWSGQWCFCTLNSKLLLILCIWWSKTPDFTINGDGSTSQLYHWAGVFYSVTLHWAHSLTLQFIQANPHLKRIPTLCVDACMCVCAHCFQKLQAAPNRHENPRHLHVFIVNDKTYSNVFQLYPAGAPLIWASSLATVHVYPAGHLSEHTSLWLIQ